MRVVGLLLLLVGCGSPRGSSQRPAEPPSAACPSAYQQSSNGLGACTPSNARCTYAEGNCFCVPTCHGGAAREPDRVDPPPRWMCFPTPPEVRPDGCPGMPPKAGEACEAARECSYGMDTSGVCWGMTLACSGNQWVYVPQDPPP